ncbi:uncharacterized protein STEHIDRAFT_124540 [Stereum hirsutum FP-91666 SS1]|uniref:uncharacterized protein n=1 Tax=Stereum hirsutum (strain FP-91666) TaxID=721885 RepID=UPI00044497C8|nr:uncharacterized protein STEHIDRAFT_124540 [Stereum hirsutum FP-91666 SS1]EIM82406.1 hypothetical protein STEHIDRAFT_124540 [Stereum hirsutum FP-91666 SS1]
MDPTESCLSILKSCPQLRSLCLPRVTSDCEKSMFPDPVRHDNLTSLTIRCDWTVPGEDEDEDDTSSIFDFIALPSLSSLIFKSDWSMNLLSFVGALAPPVIQSFIARSSCTIRHLRIDSTVTLFEYFCDFLAVVPLLEVLEYRPSDPMRLPTPFMDSLGDSFMHMLHYDPDEDNTRILLPQLKTLIMEDCHNFGKDSFFPFMVESRYGLRDGSEVANLEKVSFIVEDDLGPDGMDALTSLMIRGLDVRLKRRLWENEKEGIEAINPAKSLIHSIVQVLPSLG